MTLARTSNQLLRSQGNDTTTVAANYPITGDGSTQLPLGLAEDYSGADGESLTFDIADITDGHRVTISGSQGSSSFDVLNGQDGANGVNGVNGSDGQSVAFDITNINNGHRVTLSGEQGSSSFDVMNGDDGVDGVSPTFRFAENEDGITVIVSGAQGEDSFTLYNGEGGHAYSAGPNIDITDYTISGKDWTAEIESAISSVSGNYYPMTGNPSGFLTAHQDISNLMPKSESANFYPMTGNPSGFLTAVDLSNYYTKNETSSREEISVAIAAIPGAVDYTAGTNIDVTNHVISGKDWSTEINDAATAGSAAAASWVSEQNYLTAHQDVTNLPYVQNSALDYTQSMLISSISGHELYAESANHAFTADTANYVVSGWEYSSDKITGYAGSAFSAGSTYDVTAGANIDVTTAGNTFGISGKDWTDTITAASAYAASQAQGTEYTAGANIDITNHVVSGKDWSTEITAASAYAASQGKTYTGVAPIVVNNDEDKVSANCIELSAGNGIDSNKLAIGTIEVSGGLGGSFESSAFGIVPSQQVTALTSLSYYDTGVGNSNQLSGNNTNNLGWTMPSAYANVKNDIITDTMPEVSSRYSYLLSYTTPVTGFTSNSGLEIRKYVGDTGTTRKVLSGNSTLGELVPEDYTNRQYLTTNAAGNMQWSDIVDSAPVVLVATSGDIPATGATDGKLYVVTGSGT